MQGGKLKWVYPPKRLFLRDGPTSPHYSRSRGASVPLTSRVCSRETAPAQGVNDGFPGVDPSGPLPTSIAEAGLLYPPPKTQVFGRYLGLGAPPNPIFSYCGLPPGMCLSTHNG